MASSPQKEHWAEKTGRSSDQARSVIESWLFSVDIIERPLVKQSPEQVFERIRTYGRATFRWPEAELQSLALNVRLLNTVINDIKDDPSAPEVKWEKTSRSTFYYISPNIGASLEDLQANWKKRFHVSLREGHKGIFDVRTVRRLQALSKKQVILCFLIQRTDTQHSTSRRTRPPLHHRICKRHRPHRKRGDFTKFPGGIEFREFMRGVINPLCVHSVAAERGVNASVNTTVAYDTSHSPEVTSAKTSAIFRFRDQQRQAGVEYLSEQQQMHAAAAEAEAEYRDETATGTKFSKKWRLLSQRRQVKVVDVQRPSKFRNKDTILRILKSITLSAKMCDDPKFTQEVEELQRDLQREGLTRTQSVKRQRGEAVKGTAAAVAKKLQCRTGGFSKSDREEASANCNPVFHQALFENAVASASLLIPPLPLPLYLPFNLPPFQPGLRVLRSSPKRFKVQQ